MSGIIITVYNDDQYARDIQVVQLSTINGQEIRKYKVQHPAPNDECSDAENYELLPGDILIVTATGT